MDLWGRRRWPWRTEDEREGDEGKGEEDWWRGRVGRETAGREEVGDGGEEDMVVDCLLAVAFRLEEVQASRTTEPVDFLLCY